VDRKWSWLTKTLPVLRSNKERFNDVVHTIVTCRVAILLSGNGVKQTISDDKRQ